MASRHKFWKLKSSLRSTFGYKGELSQRGRLKPLIDIETPQCSVYETAATPVSSFTKFSTSSRTTAADPNSSIVYSSKRQALSSLEPISCVFSSPSIYVGFLQSNCRYSSFEGKRESTGGRLCSVTGQPLERASFQNDRKNLLMKRLVLSSSTPHAWKQQRLCDRTLAMKTSGLLCEENEGFGLQEALVWKKGRGWGIAYFYLMFLEKATMQGLYGSQLMLHHSNARFLSYSKKFYREFLSCGRFGGNESSGVVFDGYQDPHYAKDLSSDLDNEGVKYGNLRLLSGAFSLPHPKKVKTGGEDAYFICSEEQVVGVADGVGGWADVGVDAGDYARELMLQSSIAVAQEPHGQIDPARVMLQAHAKTKCRGSATACILALSDYGLHAANLGDSGFILIRNGRTIFKSPVQQHQFNIPFQLESGGSDPPSAAEVFSLQVSAGDVLVAGTDGLFDNLYDNELMAVVMQSIRAGSNPQVTAKNIVALARERAEDRNRQTPFSTAAQEAGFRFYGGKIDDITVIVSYIATTK